GDGVEDQASGGVGVGRVHAPILPPCNESACDRGEGEHHLVPVPRHLLADRAAGRVEPPLAVNPLAGQPVLLAGERLAAYRHLARPERLNNDRRLGADLDRKSTRLNSSHLVISYAVFCLKKKNNKK